MRWAKWASAAAVTLAVACGCAHEHRPTPRPGLYSAEPYPSHEAPRTSDRGTVFVDPYQGDAATF